eukprot:jgi/Psemu1/305715/fgenesh1_kg.214_\
MVLRSPFLYGEIQSVEFDIVYDDRDHDHDHGDSSSTVSGETRRNPLDHRESQQDRGQTPYDSPSSFDFSFSEDVDTECYEDPSSSPSIVASSVLYDGDCNVSVEAMMCHGGGLDNMMDKFIDYDELFDYEDEDGTDDDEDDDDNDGHSSMLSNASLRRSKSTRREKTRRYASSGSTKSDQKQATYVKKVVRLDNMLQLELEQQRCCERKRVHHSFDNFAVPTPLKTVSFIRDQSPKPQNCCSDGLQPAFIVKRKR